MRKLENILVTGGCGFIGANFIHYLFNNSDFEGKVINFDCLTYAANASYLADISEKWGGNRYFFEKIDITDFDAVRDGLQKYEIDTIVHFAAESHVDRSIEGPAAFVYTNVIGTFNMLEAARSAWNGRSDTHFHHVSTDEVFGSLGAEGLFNEGTAYDPRSPYSASKASADHLVRAYYHTYGLPVTVSNCSNNYGRFQHTEKLIPLMIRNLIDRKPLPVYGDGKNIRDWLYVEDHVSAIWAILESGRLGETYTIGGENEWENITLVNRLCEIVAAQSNADVGELKALITYVEDRPGHDQRYAVDCSKIRKELGWSQSVTFQGGLERTVRWYAAKPVEQEGS
jgi:dTDP-glucose 4,6-dehydratase